MTNTTEIDGLTLFGSFTSSSSYKPMLYLALARLPFSFRTVNLKYHAQKDPDYLAVNRYGQVPALRHRGLGQRAEVVHHRRIDLAEPAVVPHLGDVGDGIRLPGKPFPRRPAGLLRRAFEAATPFGHNL